MDPKLLALSRASMPKFNDDIVNGLACREIPLAEDFVHRMFKCAAPDFPPDFSYEGYSRCTPQESFRVLIERHSGQSTLELARTDVYMVKYMFKWKGEDIKPCYLYLPYVNDAGMIHIRGSVFAISPVLADRSISVGSGNIFVPLNRDKLTFNRLSHHFYANGQPVQAYVVWSSIYHLNKKQQRAAGRPLVKGHTTLMHYLFAKFGVKQTFARFANVDVVVGSEEQINANTYPPESWVICSSTKRKPIDVKVRDYVGTPLVVAVPKDQYDLKVASMIGGFFYVVDRFPDRVGMDDGVPAPEYVDHPRMWQTLLGHLIFGSSIHEGKLVEDVLNHLKSLDGYVDNEVRLRLQSDDIFVQDLYDLFVFILETFTYRISNAAARVASMYDKQLMVLRYVLQDITKGINNFMYKLNSNNRKALTPLDIRKVMDRYLKLQTVLNINKKHGEVASVSSPGDNKFFKITSSIVAQTDSSGTGGKGRASLDDAANLLDASIAEVGSYLTPGKSSPTGRGKINPFVRISEDGGILRDPEKQPLIDAVQRRIQR